MPPPAELERPLTAIAYAEKYGLDGSRVVSLVQAGALRGAKLGGVWHVEDEPPVGGDLDVTRPPVASPTPRDDASAWWGARRGRYNVGLALAGATAFLLYCAALEAFPHALPNAEVTAFTIAFQGVGYLLMMGVANVCYLLGPLSERLLRPADVGAYRETRYRLGCAFSFALPFTLPALVVYDAFARM